jgi:hypothetical protein
MHMVGSVGHGISAPATKMRRIRKNVPTTNQGETQKHDRLSAVATNHFLKVLVVVVDVDVVVVVVVHDDDDIAKTSAPRLRVDGATEQLSRSLKLCTVAGMKENLLDLSSQGRP